MRRLFQAEDLYGGGSSDMPAESSQSPAEKPKEKKEGDEGETALVPKTLCPDMKVGDEMVVKIVGEQEKDWVVAYAPEEGKEKPEEGGAAPADGGAPGGNPGPYE